MEIGACGPLYRTDTSLPSTKVERTNVQFVIVIFGPYHRCYRLIKMAHTTCFKHVLYVENYVLYQDRLKMSWNQSILKCSWTQLSPIWDSATLNGRLFHGNTPCTVSAITAHVEAAIFKWCDVGLASLGSFHSVNSTKWASSMNYQAERTTIGLHHTGIETAAICLVCVCVMSQ